jgi:endonuclease-8
MPEGDALFKFAATMRPALEGKTIRAARAHGPGPVPQVARIVGATCTGVRARGKNMIISFNNGLALRGHLRMYGTWHVYAPGEPWKKPQRQARLVLEVDGAVVVNFNAPVIELLEERALPRYAPVAGLGPDLLDETFDAGEVLPRFRDPLLAGQAIGDAIMDQRVMAGVGNIWKHETLFRCRLNPWRTVAGLDDETLLSVIDTARRLLHRSVGRPLPPDQPGRPTMYVYKRQGFPCYRCHAKILSAPQGNDIRRTAWCPRCQPATEGQQFTARMRGREAGR